MTDVLELLREALGDAVSVQPSALEDARLDKSGHRSDSKPLVVVSARSIDDVQAVMRIATSTRTPVVTRGAGTGLAGGAIARQGEIVLSTLAMNRLLEVSIDDELAVVEPGILNGDLNAQLRTHGLWFVPDPASSAISTVGGNIATNAGGLLCIKYGVTRDSVLGLKVVLADGRLIHIGHRTVKGVTGLDLTALMVGSEGILGVIVEATVKVRTLVPGSIATVSASFASVDAAARACAAISASGVKPSVLELIGVSAVERIVEHLGIDHPGGAQLIVQTDGSESGAEAATIVTVLRSLGASPQHSSDPDESARILSIRRSFHAAMASRGNVLIEDVCVPRSQLAAMFEVISEIERKYDVAIPTVAHAGDGNLHPNFVFEGDEVPERIWMAADELFLAALRLGGTLTGEHGIGLLKRRWLGNELGTDQLDLQRQVKNVFDPLGILNPGKVFGSMLGG